MSDALDGATPIDEDEAGDLLPTHIRTRDELNAWEQANIVAAAEWLGRSRRPALDEALIRELHRRMFDRTWRWAGRYRKSDKNLGAYWATVPTEVRNLVDDGQYWISNRTYPVDEAFVRLHHRLVRIHPFPNGNGRHARLWTDFALARAGRQPFDWTPDLDREGSAPVRYVTALRRADAGHYDELFDLLLRDRS